MEANETNGLLRIGVFSRLTRISVRMIRHYQDNGLLEPGWVDPASGYRYFDAQQIGHAQLIIGLRNAGFSIEQTRAVLAARGDVSLLSNLLADQSQRLEAEHEQVAERVRALAVMSATLREKPMNYNVRTESLPAMTVASLRRTVGTFADEGELWREIMSRVAESTATFPAGGLAGATFYDPEYRDANVDIAVWVQTTAQFDAVDPLECHDVPAQDVVVATLEGDYSQMGAVTAAIGEYLAEHSIEAGPMFNIYRVGPGSDPNPAHWVTDVCFPVLAL
ncbi:MerR family transcriptional regulator [Lysinibacter cavernae]|uniref:DNA-binding transcriptional MerR regulator n=1 Tax=Lysinibacter cavernae TaxID=1640652 RepID=A0A7X5TV84_9MICO|nr:MerR family transcriptional regulator [Lysinibacter cavernae]NIH54577.1 DNA-binding transcriptional MerR regulator [Lysinibacter cavernae]